MLLESIISGDPLPPRRGDGRGGGGGGGWPAGMTGGLAAPAPSLAGPVDCAASEM